MDSTHIIYEAQSIEKKWQDIWDKKGFFSTSTNNDKENYYVLEMFPYPSGRIHMGHVRVYTLGDVLARYKRAQGYNVLHPMGWDAFGMPAENAAFENNIHPKKWTKENIENMKKQLKSMGISYDWSREISTCDDNYITHQQKLFIKLFKSKLVYKKQAWANWDPVEKTVLANEQVIDGKGWRSGVDVEKKKLNQWFLSITSFANELLEGLNKLKNWPENVITMQKNWIGKSHGVQIKFKIVSNNALLKDDQYIDVFSTRPDTMFGATFLAIAPDHSLAKDISNKSEKVKNFIREWESTFSDEATLEKEPKKGVFTNLFVKHPFKEKKLPIYIANFVLSTYGTGAIFGVPAHDQRDLDFAIKYNLEVIDVVKSENPRRFNEAYSGDGTIFNSDFLDGKTVESAKEYMTQYLEKLKIGIRKTKFRLRDWCASRQRYWGCPIPIIYREDGKVIPVTEEDLPIKLPEDIDFSKNGNPLENHPTWKHTTCKKTGMKAIRETDTLDTFFDSSWYYLKFIDPNSSTLNKEKINSWCPVHQYVGGIEHAVLHLLYSRFFVKALKSMGELNFDEPFQGLFCQGMVCHKTFKDKNNKWVYPEDVIKKDNILYHRTTGEELKELRSEKMSKSKKNIVDPVDIIRHYGADTARIFMLSDSPPERKLEWSNSGIEGSKKYIIKIWAFFKKLNLKDIANYDEEKYNNEIAIDIRNKTHFFTNKITKSLDSFHYNVAVASLREFSNYFMKSSIKDSNNPEILSSLKNAVTKWTVMISPMMPHLAEELWREIGKKESIFYNVKWPNVNKVFITDEDIKLVVQVNGKKKFLKTIPKGLSKIETEKSVLNSKDVKLFLSDKKIKKIIVIPEKIINIVI